VVKKSVIYRHSKMGPVVCTETSVRDYHYTLRNNPGEPISELGVLVYRSFANCIRHPTENCRMITNADSRRLWPESVVGCFQLQSQYCRQGETKHRKCLRDYEPLSPKYEAKVPVPTLSPSVSIPESLKRRIVDWTSVTRFQTMFSRLCSISISLAATATGWMPRLCDTHSATHPVPTGESSPRGKRSGREPDHSLLSSGKTENE
jgi:hypothetical protein